MDKVSFTFADTQDVQSYPRDSYKVSYSIGQPHIVVSHKVTKSHIVSSSKSINSESTMLSLQAAIHIAVSCIDQVFDRS